MGALGLGVWCARGEIERDRPGASWSEPYKCNTSVPTSQLDLILRGMDWDCHTKPILEEVKDQVLLGQTGLVG